jgi:NitT/TauT family transport system substrate-binding protein
MKHLRHTLTGAAMALALAGQALGQGEPEMKEITLGLPVTTSTFLPIYLAAEEGFFEEEGLKVEVVAFRGGTDMVRGMIADAVQIGCTAFAGVTVGIAADQPLKVFYGGFNMAIFDWLATPDITSIADTRGKRFGVTTIGSSTDFLTRYALQLNGIDPKTDVTIVQGGGSAARMAAMAAGQLDVNIYAPPEKFIAADQGYNVILRQTDLAEDYPFHVFFAKEEFLRDNPNTVRAFLRGFVKGVRLAKADRERSIRTLIDRIGMDEKYAGRTYDDFIDSIHEDGRMASKAGMDSFWTMGVDAGTYDAAWPEERYLTRDWIDSYESWKP